MTTVCLDYDFTYTLDPKLWGILIEKFQEAGWKVICITGRRNVLSNVLEIRENLPTSVQLYFSYDQPKEQYAKERGLEVDVWIDDDPAMILLGRSTKADKWRKIEPTT